MVRRISRTRRFGTGWSNKLMLGQEKVDTTSACSDFSAAPWSPRATPVALARARVGHARPLRRETHAPRRGEARLARGCSTPTGVNAVSKQGVQSVGLNHPPPRIASSSSTLHRGFTETRKCTGGHTAAGRVRGAPPQDHGALETSAICPPPPEMINIEGSFANRHRRQYLSSRRRSDCLIDFCGRSLGARQGDPRLASTRLAE